MVPLRSQQGGAVVTPQGTAFTVWSHHAERIELCLFDQNGMHETARVPMRREGDLHHAFVENLAAGARYGFRAHGRYEPDQGFWFDPSKLLVDPYAQELDRPFQHDERLSVYGIETQDIVPKAIVGSFPEIEIEPPRFSQGGFIYELGVKPFTMLQPDIPSNERGTVAALAHPSVIAHLKKLGVDAIELMPITAWIDERHLPPLGLTNGWGYNPVAFMALDPRLVPGGVTELRDTVETLHAAGIGVILDLVFNHTGESDRLGPTLSLRGLDNLSFYRHVTGQPDVLVNDTGCGNTVACNHPYIRRLIIDTLRHFVLHAGIDGFRFDLATILGRTATGFERDHGTLSAILADDVLTSRVMIAEPWDIGPGGYQLGRFPAPFLEWNDRARDDMRRFWRGDAHKTGALATILAGSSDLFHHHNNTKTRSVNFIAAHDGFTLADLVSHERKHNEANGEDNRDGHSDNHSWNNGVEGRTDDLAVQAKRRQDVMALISTLFVSRGTVMLTAGDESGHTKRGNNNAYCQDNDMTWLDWGKMDQTLIAHTAFMSKLRKRFSALTATDFLNGDGDVEWVSDRGHPMQAQDWQAPNLSAFAMVLRTQDHDADTKTRLAIMINQSDDQQCFTLPASSVSWMQLTPEGDFPAQSETCMLAPRAVSLLIETDKASFHDRP